MRPASPLQMTMKAARMRRICPPMLTLGMKERAKRMAPMMMPTMRQVMFGDHAYRMGLSDGINTFLHRVIHIVDELQRCICYLYPSVARSFVMI